MFEEEYRLDFFREKGYVRRECPKCGGHFWTLNEEQELCDDSPCVEFGFLDSPPASEKLSVPEMRKFFIDFFAERGHAPLERYPVVARWRDDVFLVHASIYDFQPHVTSGMVEPPANPLVISQPSIRLSDIDEVGMTGKHQTGFEMMGHHSFNSEDNFIYWKEETIQYCHDMLMEMGVDEELITYKEKPWIGGGNAGPSLEVLVLGLEVATLVFMNLEKDKEGEIEVGGDLYSPLYLNIVDTGYGLERLSWITEGSPTILDSIYPDIIEYICEQIDISHDLSVDWYHQLIKNYTLLSSTMEKDYTDEELIHKLMDRIYDQNPPWGEEEIIEHLDTLKSVYIIADHSRTIAFMLADGVVPSNVAEGYLARMVIRRTLRQIANLHGQIRLKDIVQRQMEKFNDIIDMSKKDVVFDMLDSEIEKYEETLEKGKNLVRKELKGLDMDSLSTHKLIEFYDTHGIHPSIVKELGHEFGMKIDIPENFNVLLAEMHEAPEEKEGEGKEEYDHPETDKIYYEKSDLKEFEARVIGSGEGEVILDRTGFYPEGGGQLCDKGELKADGETYPVKYVRNEEGVIVHEIDGYIPKGTDVTGIIDWERRMSLTRHHTATHIIISSARKVLGDHIWQRGAQKSVDRARLDISHYKRITREQVKEIERIANKMVLDDVPVVKEELTRDEAEKRFGFELYQGGVPTSDVIRVVHISDVRDYDAQACGGTHVGSTAEVGAIKVLNTQRIQDGVERLEYSAGLATIEYIQNTEDILNESAGIFSVQPDDLPEVTERFFKEWKQRGKELEKLKKYKSMAVADELLPGEMEKGIEFVIAEVDMGEKEMLATAERVVTERGRVALLASQGEPVQLVFSRSDDLDVNMVDILREAAREINGGGGGTPKTAQGGGSKPDGRKDALNKAKELILKSR